MTAKTLVPIALSNVDHAKKGPYCAAHIFEWAGPNAPPPIDGQEWYAEKDGTYFALLTDRRTLVAELAVASFHVDVSDYDPPFASENPS